MISVKLTAMGLINGINVEPGLKLHMKNVLTKQAGKTNSIIRLAFTKKTKPSQLFWRLW